MDISKIVQFRLIHAEFKKIEIDDAYRIVHLTESNYLNYLDDILYVIELLHLDLDWDGIPTKEKVIDRFNNKSECFLWVYKDNVVGWTWFNKNVTMDWINIYQKLDKNEVYVGGAFLSKKIKTPAIASFKFYNYSFDTWIKKLNYNTIYLYSDDWNRASAILCYKSGFTKYNFIKSIK